MGMAAGVVPIVGHLPETGGTLDQCAWLMDAFSILNEVDAKMAPPVG
jgi:hypothetical protein